MKYLSTCFFLRFRTELQKAIVKVTIEKTNVAIGIHVSVRLVFPVVNDLIARAVANMSSHCSNDCLDCTGIPLAVGTLEVHDHICFSLDHHCILYEDELTFLPAPPIWKAVALIA